MIFPEQYADGHQQIGLDSFENVLAFYKPKDAYPRGPYASPPPL